MSNSHSENYQYWQNNGQGWFEEYERRKTFIPYFHFQEIFLSEYIGKFGPARVLEFGSGVGRHLRNIRKIPHIEAYGFDQSPTMVADMAKWCEESWIKEHVFLGQPLDKLPFDEKNFDIVYTSEVLVHVRPEDIRKVIENIVAVSKRRILHIEPEPTTTLVSDAHGGCWGHDLHQIYHDLGLKTKSLPKLFESQTIIEVSIDGTNADYPFSEQTAELFRKFEEYISFRLNRDINEEMRQDAIT